MNPACDDWDGLYERIRRLMDAYIASPEGEGDANGELIIALAISSGVPAIYPRPVFAETGGLIAYGADLLRRALPFQ